MHEPHSTPLQCLHALSTLCGVPMPRRERCPYCASSRLHRWGKFAGRQRFRCVSCRRTFSDLTGTPAAYSKHIELWLEYASCMHTPLTLRQCAARLKIAVSTAFRWRHAILDASRAMDCTTLSGRVQLHELRLAHSKKGSRRLNRPARTRGVRARDPHLFNTRRVCVITACDQDNRTFSQHIDAQHLRSEDLRAVLLPRLRKPVTIVSARGPFSCHAVLAHAASAVLDWIRPNPGAQLSGVATFQRRIRSFLLRFRGVATKYLDNYLRWHRVLEPRCA
jgi:transposase-like protein